MERVAGDLLDRGGVRVNDGNRYEDPRVEELLRVNAELAAEVRNLTLGRADAPRSAAMPTSRRLAALIDERDTLRERLEKSEAEAEVLRSERERLTRRERELSQEVERLRAGFAGVLRRVRGRLLAGRRS
jgi:predicted  nucleic acid-binding Zn-ribbon protein